MIFSLGALAALLLALSVLPALDRRAQRLARRRLEALFPMSIAEIAAERDHVRAAMAVEARRVEEKANAASRERAESLADIGRRDAAIRALNETIAARDGALADLRLSLANAEQQLKEMSARLEEAESRRVEADRALTTQRAAQHDVDAKLAASLQALALREKSLRISQEKFAVAEARLAESVEIQAGLQSELRRSIDTASERQLTIASLDAQLETALGETRDAARQLAQAQSALARYTAPDAASPVANSNDAPAAASGGIGGRPRSLPEAAE